MNRIVHKGNGSINSMIIMKHSPVRAKFILFDTYKVKRVAGYSVMEEDTYRA